MMDKYLENVIEITQVYTSLMAEGKLNDDIDSLTYKEAICDWAAEFETLNRKVEWDGVERDYYIEIEQFAREKLLNGFGANEEDEGGEMYLDTPIGQLYAMFGDNGVKRYMEIGLGAKGIMDLPIFAIEVPNDESDRIDLYEGTYDSNGEYKGLECIGDVGIEELNRRTLKMRMRGSMGIEQVETCPICVAENSYPDWDPEEKGYIATCETCGKKIFLCDACFHADDNTEGRCDWHEEKDGRGCFRGWIKEGE